MNRRTDESKSKHSDFVKEMGAAPLQDNAQQKKSNLTWEVKQQLISLRKTRNMTQREIGEATGMRTTNITRLERDDYDPSLEILERYAQALGKTLEISIIDQKTKEVETPRISDKSRPQSEFLDKGEKRLLAYYRSLSGKGKKMVTNMARDLDSFYSAEDEDTDNWGQAPTWYT